MARSPDWQQFVLDQPMAAAPGTRFYYSSGNSHLLSAILSKVTGKSATTMHRKAVRAARHRRRAVAGRPAGRLGRRLPASTCSRATWRRSAISGCAAACGRAADPAGGVDQGVRNADVDIRESWASDLRYGRQFWVMPVRDAFMAVGYHRQLIVVMPKLDIVAVVTGSPRFASPNGMATTPRYGFGTLVDYLTAAVTSDVSRRGQSRGDGRSRREGQGGRHRAVGAGRRRESRTGR